MLALSLGIIALGAWIYLVFGRAYFWLERSSEEIPHSLHSSVIGIIVPARNEAAVIEKTITALMEQDYSGYFHVFLVDDHSEDGTRSLARNAAQSAGKNERLTVIQAPELPGAWTGKLWALENGIRSALDVFPDIEYFLLTDADILHPPRSLSRLLARMEAGSLNGRPYSLVSLLARLHCRSLTERLMLPAFVYFFQMLYPFRRCNNPRDPIAAAAGGVMLIDRHALEQIGGIASIRGALIDDCALAAAVKRQGRIWIGLSSDIASLRAYTGISEIWRMITRTAFTQLRYSGLLLIATVLAMSVAFLAPPVLLLDKSPEVAGLGAASVLLMAGSFWPTIRFYRLNPLWALTLPLSAVVYMGATLDSARRYWRRKGGEWKGRFQAN
jgi:hopene-associated glycosyltransferase HpnB